MWLIISTVCFIYLLLILIYYLLCFEEEKFPFKIVQDYINFDEIVYSFFN